MQRRSGDSAGLQTVDKLTALLGITERLNSQRDLSSLLVVIAREAARLLDAELASLFLLDAERGELWSKVTLDTEESIRFDAHQGIAGEALRTGRVLRVDDVRRDPHFFAGVDALTGRATRSVLAVPVRNLGGQTIGVFEVLNKRTPHFTDGDVEVARLLTAQISIALETAQIVGDLKREHQECLMSNARLSREVRGRFAAHRILGSSLQIQEVIGTIEQVADSSLSVLVTGASGTGKELVAKSIHFSSPRARRPFVALNCAALPEALVESELFGIEKGVATGVDARMGKFEAAHLGTLFLDEIGDLSLVAQAKLLRVLQERVVERVGGRHGIHVDVRVLAATNKHLPTAIQAGEFREDLYYRLNTVQIRMPALREVPEDVAMLANFLLLESCRELDRPVPELTLDTLHCLREYSWPGNVRELDNEMRRVAVTVRRDRVEPCDLSTVIRNAPPASPSIAASTRLKEEVEALERHRISEALASCQHNQQRVARLLGLSRQGLIKKMKRYGITARGGS
jgi:Nif-specific regulatory protein